MNDDRGHFAARSAPRTGEDAAREARHALLAELLGAYADRELPPETMSQIDAHLLGCPRCRRELAMHESLRGRLALEPPSAGSPALRDRIRSAIQSLPADVGSRAVDDERSPLGFWRPQGRRLWLTVTAFVMVLAGAAFVGAHQVRTGAAGAAAVRELTVGARSVPLLDVVLEDYTRVTAGDLPGRARDLAAVRGAVPFPVEPLQGPRLRLLAAWTTDLRGEPAAVLAYRLEDGLILQYLVSEQLFFRHPAVRSAVSARHLMAAADGPRGIVAWPEAAAGSLVVAEMPPDRLAALWAAEQAR